MFFGASPQEEAEGAKGGTGAPEADFHPSSQPQRGSRPGWPRWLTLGLQVAVPGPGAHLPSTKQRKRRGSGAMPGPCPRWRAAEPAEGPQEGEAGAGRAAEARDEAKGGVCY